MKSHKEKAQSIFAAILLANRVEVAITEAQINEGVARYGVARDTLKGKLVAHAAWNDLYYGASAKVAAAALKSLAVDFPKQAALFAPAAAAVAAGAEADKLAREAQKADKLARREAKTAKAAKKVELGAELKGASETTYLALRAGLVDVEAALAGHIAEGLRNTFNDLSKTLAEHGGDYRAAFTVLNRRGERVHELPDNFDLFFKYTPNWTRAFAYDSVSSRITSAANRRAADAVGGYSAKLAGKIDNAAPAGAEVDWVKVAISRDIWTGSVLTVALTDGSRQSWNTKIIWNQSVYGRQFNQWPTTRLA